ncbi:hypothetical protein DWX43_23140 [Clostridium sp. AF19-22AC]|jgi:hypothetical protein|uniref:hypothetical protein n=1 Tax=Clostridia TaxID=186801 RepID=UPI000E498307|nr:MULTISPECIES: hypothetical protein [Clostridia]RHR21910.1 hypothetical protein DWX43_23140 [Clostridium sp. AF19-22AC]
MRKEYLKMIMLVAASIFIYLIRGQIIDSNPSANASVVAGLGIALISQSWVQVLAGALVGIGVIVVVSTFFQRKTN